MSLFKKAVKAESKLRLAIAGPSGSGKTYTALAIAMNLAGGRPVALVDTEHGSASKYASLFNFDVAEMHPPFHPDKFISAIREAQQAGYVVLILDSISHAWSGTGGVLDIVDEAAKRSKSGNTYMAWKEGTPVQNRLIDAIVQSGIHVIVTMRSKTEYVLADVGGKQAPRKVGMAPVQRDQFEYEFDVVFDMDIENNAIVSKTRCPVLSGRVFARPGADVAGILVDWLHGEPVERSEMSTNGTSEHTEVSFGMGEQPAEQPEPPKAQTNGHQPKAGLITEAQRNTLHALGTVLYNGGWDAKRHELVKATTKGRATGSNDLWQAEAKQLISGKDGKGGLEGKVREAYTALAEQLTAGVAVIDPNVLAEVDVLQGVELANALKALRELSEKSQGSSSRKEIEAALRSREAQEIEEHGATSR